MTAEEAAGVDVRAESRPRRAGDRLPASYINFLHRQQVRRHAPVRQAPGCGGDAHSAPPVPTRKVIGVATREVLLGGGNIHCITQQVPRPASS